MQISQIEAMKMVKEGLPGILQFLAKDIWNNAHEKGFWQFEAPSGNLICNDGEKIALMHSELSEALEGIRGSTPTYSIMDQHCHEFKSVEIELADCVIRILDYCHARKLRIGEAILAKHEYNKTRPYKHGKNF